MAAAEEDTEDEAGGRETEDEDESEPESEAGSEGEAEAQAGSAGSNGQTGVEEQSNRAQQHEDGTSEGDASESDG